MLRFEGFRRPDGCPGVKLFISSRWEPDRARSYEALIDTGFSGFLSLPEPTARELGIEPRLTTEVILADGAVYPRGVGLAVVRLPAEQRLTEGVCILEPSSRNILLGMGFLDRLKLSLIVHDRYVALVDSDAMWNAINGPRD